MEKRGRKGANSVDLKGGGRRLFEAASPESKPKLDDFSKTVARRIEARAGRQTLDLKEKKGSLPGVLGCMCRMKGCACGGSSRGAKTQVARKLTEGGEKKRGERQNRHASVSSDRSDRRARGRTGFGTKNGSEVKMKMKSGTGSGVKSGVGNGLKSGMAGSGIGKLGTEMKRSGMGGKSGSGTTTTGSGTVDSGCIKTGSVSKGLRVRQGSLRSLLDCYTRLKDCNSSPCQRSTLLRMKSKMKKIFEFIDGKLSRLGESAGLRRRRERAAVIIQRWVRGFLARKYFRRLRRKRRRAAAIRGDPGEAPTRPTGFAGPNTLNRTKREGSTIDIKKDTSLNRREGEAASVGGGLRAFIVEEARNWQVVSSLVDRTNELLLNNEGRDEIRKALREIQLMTRGKVESLRTEVDGNIESARVPAGSASHFQSKQDNIAPYQRSTRPRVESSTTSELNAHIDPTLRRLGTAREAWPRGPSRMPPSFSLALENKSGLVDSERRFFLSDRDPASCASLASLEKKLSVKTLRESLRLSAAVDKPIFRCGPLSPAELEAIEIPLPLIPLEAEEILGDLMEEMIGDKVFSRLLDRVEWAHPREDQIVDRIDSSRLDNKSFREGADSIPSRPRPSSPISSEDNESVFGIRANINAINEYCLLLSKFIYDHHQDSLLRKFTVAKLGPLPSICPSWLPDSGPVWQGRSPGTYPLSSVIYLDLERQILDGYKDLNILSELYEIQRIFHRSVFDSFNETLASLLFNWRKFELSPFEASLLSKDQLSSKELETILIKAKSLVVENSAFLCGLLQEKEDSLLDSSTRNLDPLSLQCNRDDRLFKAISSELKGAIDPHWNFRGEQNTREDFIASVCEEVEELLLREVVDGFSF